jgi:NADH-quinone oxidoreductase subunit H
VLLLNVDNLNLIINLTLSELSILGCLMAGYASNEKYSLLGSLRVIGVMISYSISMSLSLKIFILLINSADYEIIKSIQQSNPLLLALLPATLT